MVAALVFGDAVDEFSTAVPESFDGSFGGTVDEPFEFGEELSIGLKSGL